MVLQLCHHDKSGARRAKKDVTPFHAMDADRFSSYYIITPHKSSIS